MAINRIISRQSISEQEENFNISLRPKSLDECVGQCSVKEKLSIAITAAKQRSEPLEHILFYGPPGLGKTTLANVVANEMETTIRCSSGPAMVKQGDVMGLLSNINTGDVLFIDEVHRLSTPVEEFIYPAMEEFKVDFTVDSGLHAKTINFPLKCSASQPIRNALSSGFLQCRRTNSNFEPLGKLTGFEMRRWSAGIDCRTLTRNAASGEPPVEAGAGLCAGEKHGGAKRKDSRRCSGNGAD